MERTALGPGALRSQAASAAVRFTAAMTDARTALVARRASDGWRLVALRDDADLGVTLEGSAGWTWAMLLDMALTEPSFDRVPGVLGAIAAVPVGDEPRGAIAVLDRAPVPLGGEARRRLQAVAGLLGRIEELWEAPAPVGASEVDLAELVADVAQQTRDMLSRPGVHVSFVGAGRLRTAGATLRRLLLELTTNAARFTERGRIAISAEETPTGATLLVAHTGGGLNRQQLGRLVTAYLGDAPVARGVGLGTVRRLASELGATVVLDDVGGFATTVRVDVPAS